MKSLKISYLVDETTQKRTRAHRLSSNSASRKRETVKRVEPNSADMKPISIAGTGSYVAPKVMTNQDWTKYVDTSDEWIYGKTGIRERRIADPGVATSDLATEAAKKALADARVKAKDVDLIVLATSSPDVPLSATACIVQHKLRQEISGSGCQQCAAALSTP
jgi:3-oxoacyl-[acyl-carrier-protein] synthase III